MEKELHRIVTTCLVYNTEGKYLVTKRSMEKRVHPGKWTVPGGGLTVDDYIDLQPNHGKEGHENVLTIALKREVKEETGLEIGEPQLLVNFAFIRPDGIPVLVFGYVAPAISGEVTLDGDAVEYAWISGREAARYDLIPGIREEMEKADALLGFN